MQIIIVTVSLPRRKPAQGGGNQPCSTTEKGLQSTHQFWGNVPKVIQLISDGAVLSPLRVKALVFSCSFQQIPQDPLPCSPTSWIRSLVLWACWNSIKEGPLSASTRCVVDLRGSCPFLSRDCSSLLQIKKKMNFS